MSIFRNKIIIGKTFLSLLDKELFVDIPVYGLSMFPFYLPGDLVRVEVVNSTNLRVGNVVVFVRSNRLVAHRLIKINFLSNTAITKGDGLLRRDASIALTEVKGVVIRHLRKGDEVKLINSRFFKHLIVLTTPVTGYIYFYLSRVWYKLFHK